jgi:hypothetical protein
MNNVLSSYSSGTEVDDRKRPRRLARPALETARPPPGASVFSEVDFGRHIERA